LRLGSTRALVIALGGVLVPLAAAGAVLLTHTGRSPAPATARYGGFPSWLPKPTVPVGRIVVASAAHPWLAIEGDTVSVHLTRGRVLATVVGPAVPEEGRSPIPSTTPCTFTVTFTGASGIVPLRPGAFTILDEYGHLHHPRMAVAGDGRPPLQVARGQTVTLTLRSVLPVGGGRLSWAPGGAAPIVSWDFDVEID